MADETPKLPDLEFPLRPLVGEWLNKIRQAEEHKKKQFSDVAAECMDFYNGGAMDRLYGTKALKDTARESFRRVPSDKSEISGWQAPTFQMQANKVNEVVGLFGPVLYFKEPYRKSNPRKKPDIPKELFDALIPMTQQSMLTGVDPAMQMLSQGAQMLYQQQADRQQAIDKATSALVEWYLNWTPRETNLKADCRLAIDEGLIKGMGIVWTELTKPLIGPPVVSSFFDTIDNYQMDPDFELMKDCKWVARKCTHPVWQVEDERGLPRGTLQGSMESYNRQSQVNQEENGDYNRKKGVTNDLLVYWKVYSKMGLGGKLQGVNKVYSDVLDKFGDYAYLEIAADVPYPLNLPPGAMQLPQQEAMKKLDWPIPYWMDGKWPSVPLYFRTTPRQLWPMAHFSPAMGYLRAMNWLYSMMISKVGITCRDFIAILQQAGDEVINAILHGRDLTLLKISSTGPQSVQDIVQFLQHPEMQADVWKVLDSVRMEFEKATGLSELVYGMSSRQMRSAQEATLKGDQISVRPDDMANKVEDWATAIARNECFAMAWCIKGEHVEPLIGKPAAVLWTMLIDSDPLNVMNRLEVGIEAGSTVKPNKDRDVANMQTAMQNLFQPFFMVAQSTAFVKPVNAIITDWCKSLDLDPTNYTFPDLPPPPPPMPPGGAPPGAPPGQEGAATGDAASAAPPPGQQVSAPPMPAQAPITVGGF